MCFLTFDLFTFALLTSEGKTETDKNIKIVDAVDVVPEYYQISLNTSLSNTNNTYINMHDNDNKR